MIDFLNEKRKDLEKGRDSIPSPSWKKFKNEIQNYIDIPDIFLKVHPLLRSDLSTPFYLNYPQAWDDYSREGSARIKKRRDSVKALKDQIQYYEDLLDLLDRSEAIIKEREKE